MRSHPLDRRSEIGDVKEAGNDFVEMDEPDERVEGDENVECAKIGDGDEIDAGNGIDDNDGIEDDDIDESLRGPIHRRLR